MTQAPAASSDDQVSPGWWLTQDIEVNAGRRWCIGPLELNLLRYPLEWHLVWRSDVNNNMQQNTCKPIAPMDVITDDFNTERFITHTTSPAVTLQPRTADRDMVIRPQEPLTLPSQEETVLYVSTPAWIEVQVGKTKSALREVPIVRPSDTWFGPSLMVGELCYDSRTRGKLNLDDVQHLSHRIVTPLCISNKADTPLALERVSIPVPYLSVYACADNHLWTEQVTLVREEDGELAALKIGKGPPRLVRGARKISDPRQQSDRNMLVRAFGGLFK